MNRKKSSLITTQFIESNGTFDDHYHTGRTLGKGSFATVHLAINKATNKRYAAKIIHREDMSTIVLGALSSELDILRTIHHPSIVFVREIFGSSKDFVRDTPTVSIVMELMGGGELFDRIIDKQYYSEREAKIALKQILEAIDYCHNMNIIHRDIKPENLLYVNESDSASLKLADFGLAVKMVPGVQLTQICGTPTYVAPEILDKSDRGYGLQADLWSIGVILYILLCGCPPFYDDDTNELFMLIQKAEFDFPAKFWNNVSKDAKDLVTKLIVADPQKRLNAKETLAHPWLSLESLSSKETFPLHIADNLKIFNGKKRMKAVRHSIGAINFMRKEASSHNLGSGSGKWQVVRRNSINNPNLAKEKKLKEEISGSGSDKFSKTETPSNNIAVNGQALMEAVDFVVHLKGLKEALIETDSAATSAGASAATSGKANSCSVIDNSPLSQFYDEENEIGGGSREVMGGGIPGLGVISNEIESQEEKDDGFPHSSPMTQFESLSTMELQLSEKECNGEDVQNISGNESRRGAVDKETLKEREDKAEAKKKRKKEREAASSNLLAQAAAMMTAQCSLKELEVDPMGKLRQTFIKADAVSNRKRYNSMIDGEDQRGELWSSTNAKDIGSEQEVDVHVADCVSLTSGPDPEVSIEVESNHPKNPTEKSMKTDKSDSSKSSKREKIFAGLDSLRSAVSDCLNNIVSVSSSHECKSPFSRKGVGEERTVLLKGLSSLSRPQRLIDEAYAYFGKEDAQLLHGSLEVPRGNAGTPVSSHKDTDLIPS